MNLNALYKCTYMHFLVQPKPVILYASKFAYYMHIFFPGAISSIFEDLGPLQNQNFKPHIDFDRVLNPLFFFNLVPGHKYGVSRYYNELIFVKNHENCDIFSEYLFLNSLFNWNLG